MSGIVICRSLLFRSDAYFHFPLVSPHGYRLSASGNASTRGEEYRRVRGIDQPGVFSTPISFGFHRFEICVTISKSKRRLKMNGFPYDRVKTADNRFRRNIASSGGLRISQTKPGDYIIGPFPTINPYQETT
jgi:hypothetical protein